MRLPILLCLVSGLWAGYERSRTPRAMEAICVTEADGSEVVRHVTDDVAADLLSSTVAYRGPCAIYGPPALLGQGALRAFVTVEKDHAPVSIGVVFPVSALDLLPSAPHDGFRCLDLDGDRSIDVDHECVGGHERVLFLPSVWEDSVPSPFKWVLFNWNPVGHGPPGVWDAPHFDFHFFIQDLQDRNRIRIGRCAMLVDCEDLEAGARPVPASLLPPGYRDAGIVEFGMGSHLIDPTTFGTPGSPSDITLVYGSWNGAVSFIEPMIKLAYFLELAEGSRDSGCRPIPQPGDVAIQGFYPTVYCVRYRARRREYVVSLEQFRPRDWWQDGIEAGKTFEAP